MYNANKLYVKVCKVPRLLETALGTVVTAHGLL